MLRQAREGKYWGIEIKIAKLYLYLLPIRMLTQLGFLKTLFKGAAVYFDLVLHIVALLLMFLRSDRKIYLGRDKSSQVLQHFAKLILYLNFSSIFMAFIIQLVHGDYAGESAFSGIIGMLIYFTQYAFIFLYSKHIFKMLSKEEILKILRRVCLFLLCLGYLQIAAMTVGGPFIAIHDGLDIFDVLYDASKMPKLCLTGTEGASAGSLISVFVMPILYGSIIMRDNAKSSAIQIFLWLPVLYFTNSSTGFILFVAVTILFAFLQFKENGKSNMPLIILIVALIALVVFIFADKIIAILPQEIAERVRYLLIEKIADEDNGSTISRMVPFVTNWGAFTEYPLFGVGNGLQGYFYVKYFPDWAIGVAGSDVEVFLEKSKTGISNGGLFFPSLLSGYGLVGIVVIAFFVVRLFKHAKNGKKQMGIFYFIFLMSSLAILITGLQSEITGLYYLWFMLSLPLMIKDEKNDGSEDLL